MFVSVLRRGGGFAGNDEGGKAKTQSRSRPLAGSHTLNQSLHVFQRLTVDEPDIAMRRHQFLRRHRFTADINQRPRAIRVGRPQLKFRDIKIPALKDTRSPRSKASTISIHSRP